MTFNLRRKTITKLSDLTEVERKFYDIVLANQDTGVTQGFVAYEYGKTRQNAEIKLSRLVKFGVLDKIGARYFVKEPPLEE